ncbi:MAG: DUF975 family protein [Emergencia sp.]
MNNIIVRETSSEIRAIARNALSGNWTKVAVGMAVYYVMISTIPNLLAALIPGAAYTYYNETVGQHITVSYVAELYSFVLNAAFAAGLCSFLIAFFRRREINPGYIFNGFEYFIKTFCLMIVQGFFIFLWTLLLVVPGIIAAIRYSQAFYILADHPEKGIMECINESKRMMNGNKGRFFCLCLSFIGWAILASILGSVISVWSDGSLSILKVLLDFVASIPYFFFLAYMNTAETAFYELASGNLAARPEPQFREEDYHF